MWVVCALFVAVSIVGKLAGAALSARFVGESWKDSLSIGVLMNTRGLMELIVLNIGYEMGVLPSSIYVIFVIMALFTTFMATPSLVLIDKLFARRRPERRQSPYLVFVRASFQCAGFPETRKSVVRPVDRQTAHYGCALYDRYRDQSDERLRLFVREFCAAA